MAIYKAFSINGVDIRPYVAIDDGLKISEFVVNGPNAGRTLDGTAILDVIAVQKRLDVKCRDLTGIESQVVLSLLNPYALTVVYEDSKDGVVTKSMYCASWSAGVKRVKPAEDTVVWGGSSFSLVEI